MFVFAIELAAEFTRPIHTISRYFKSTEVQPGAATLFFVNDEGWALTCRHVAELIIGAEQCEARFQAFKSEFGALAKKKKRQAEKELQRKYDFSQDKLVEIKNLLVNCIEGPLDDTASPQI